MAEDINKKISIKVEAETGELTQSVTELNKTLDTLLQKQKQLSDAGLQNTKVFVCGNISFLFSGNPLR